MGVAKARTELRYVRFPKATDFGARWWFRAPRVNKIGRVYVNRQVQVGLLHQVLLHWCSAFQWHRAHGRSSAVPSQTDLNFVNSS